MRKFSGNRLTGKRFGCFLGECFDLNAVCRVGRCFFKRHGKWMRFNSLLVFLPMLVFNCSQIARYQTAQLGGCG